MTQIADERDHAASIVDGVTGESVPIGPATTGAPSGRRRAQRPVLLIAALSWLGLAVTVALFADLLPLHRPDLLVRGLAPRTPPRLSWTEPLGTDGIGRSVMSRLAYGARQSLIAAVAATAGAMAIGLALGCLAGYFRRWVDEVITVFIESLLSIPGVVLLLAIAAVGQRNMFTLITGLVIIGIPTFTRLARANTIALADREYVSAAIAMGATHRRVLLREIGPLVAIRLITFSVLFLGVVIVLEASLSFLGLGIPPPHPSWGGMVNEGRSQLATEPQLVFIPSICIVLTVAAFQVIGDWVRRRLELGGRR